MLSSLFANPWILGALGAAALPWIIEWLFRRRKRQEELPTLRFLLKSKDQEQVKRQDRILLFLRTLAVLLVVLGIARPLLQQRWLKGDVQRHVVILLDATASTQQQVGVTTSFGLSQKKSTAMIRALPKDTIVTVGCLSQSAETIIEGEKDLYAVANRVETLRAGAGAASMSEGLTWVKEYLARVGRQDAEVYVFSDFQKYTWKRPAGGSGSDGASAQCGPLLNELGRHCELFMVDVGSTPAFNYIVTDLHPAEWIVTTGMPVRFQATVEARGKTGEVRPRLTFLVDGVKKDVREVTVGEQSGSVEFEYRFAKSGEYVVEVFLEGDENPVDNRRLYLCTVQEEVRVLLIDEATESPSDEGYFLTRAIAPPVRPGFDKPTWYGVKTVAPAQLGFENLDSYAAVLLTATHPLTENLSLRLKRYVAEGGSLWIFMGPKVNIYEYNKFFFEGGAGLLPCKLSDAALPAGPTPYLNFSSSDHPALLPLSGSGGNTSAECSKYILAETNAENESSDSKVILSYSNKQPAILERTFGRGRVILFTTTASSSWTLLPALPEYPILIQSLLRYLVGNPDRLVNLNVGDRFEESVFVSSQHLLLKQPDGSRERLAPRALKDRNDLWKISWERTYQQGLYEFVDVTPEVLSRRRFVVNTTAEEGDLSRYQEGELSDALGSNGWTWLAPNRSIEEFVAGLHSVTELAPWILATLTALLVMETFLAVRFGRRRVIGTAERASP